MKEEKKRYLVLLFHDEVAAIVDARQGSLREEDELGGIQAVVLMRCEKWRQGDVKQDERIFVSISLRFNSDVMM